MPPSLCGVQSFCPRPLKTVPYKSGREGPPPAGDRQMTRLRVLFSTAAIFAALLALVSCPARAADDADARRILEKAGIAGGLIVHVGCGDGKLTAALRVSGAYLVHGLDTDPQHVAAAREYIAGRGCYGPVSVDRWDGRHLPCVDNLVNLLVARGKVPAAEIDRVLAPGGVALCGPGLQKRVKPRPENIDEWTHYLHDAGNNAVAEDAVVGPPRHLQWTAVPRWARHHDRVASMSALVSAGGRIFYIFDEGLTASLVTPSRMSLVARDAFNGVLLWKKPIPRWQTRFWPLKSGPSQLPRRLVAAGDTVYATLGIDAPLAAIDAVSGKTLRTYGETKATTEILHDDGTLYLVVDPSLDTAKYTDRRRVNTPWWEEGDVVRVTAVDAAGGKIIWQHASAVMPLTLTAGGDGVFFHDGKKVVCLDKEDGTVRWQTDPVPRVARVMSFFSPTMVYRDGVVLFAGGEESGLVKSTGGATKSDTLTAFDAKTGGKLWSAEHPPSGYSSPEDVFVRNGEVWYGKTSNGRFPGLVTGRDLHTGKEIGSFAADVETYWFHHRCYRGKATTNYLMVSRTGIEFIDTEKEHWDINHWIRGGCLYGIMPANGLVYTPPHDCICYPESKLFGFNAVAAAAARSPGFAKPAGGERLETGPGTAIAAAEQPAAEDWPTYRRDAARSGFARTAVRPAAEETWTAAVGGTLSAPVIAGGRVYVAAVDRHAVCALDAATGEVVWRTIVGGRVDSPPTVTRGRLIFGCADGCVYCLRAADGALAWRYRAAPADRRTVSFGRVESIWPLHGSVLIHAGDAWCVAGRSMFLDGGLRLLRLDPATGTKKAAFVLDAADPAGKGDIQNYVKWLNMPVALPDVLSSDGTYLYMRSQRFDTDGKRYRLAPKSRSRMEVAADQQGEGRHLFSPTGFLDGSWFHRSYWVYGRTFSGGWNGYPLNGLFVPGGRIMTVGDANVYGFGRKPQYYKWTVPLEYHLFSAPKDVPAAGGGKTAVHVENSTSLNPVGTPLAVAAWVKPDGNQGVIVSRGGPFQGYVLLLKKGRPRFAIRADKKLSAVTARKRIPRNGWTHLAGVLTADKKLQVYVNGKKAGQAAAAKLLDAPPAQATDIGMDDQGAVGDYKSPFGFGGLIDDAAIYHRGLDAKEIAAVMADPAKVDKAVLVFTFDDGTARDASGNNNHGRIEGARPAAGNRGKALSFSGSAEGRLHFAHNWTAEIPLLARGMVLAGKDAPATLFVAGPPDLVDENAAFRNTGDPAMQKKIAAQEAAWQGRKGGILLAVSAADGKALSKADLDAPPVWDGMAAARGRLFICTTAGEVVCLE